jgi:DNA-binding NarL/FixJ family response regulator
MAAGHGELTATEQLILELVRAGRPDAEIAVRAGLSTGEVKLRIDRICTKLAAKSRAELLQAATPQLAAFPES